MDMIFIRFFVFFQFNYRQALVFSNLFIFPGPEAEEVVAEEEQLGEAAEVAEMGEVAIPSVEHP